jgi:Zn-dependent M28 family amino/carboxypeptidase
MRDLLSQLLEEPDHGPPPEPARLPPRRWIKPVVIVTAVVVLLTAPILFMTLMPNKSYSGTLPPLTEDQREISRILKSRVWYLAETIGERNVFAYASLQNAADYIENSFKQLGYDVTSQQYVTETRKVRNLVAVLPGSAKASEIVVVGAHYDTVDECPGADDNASGVAALLELARLLKDSHPARTIRFVAFVNEEPPWFQTDNMGSLVYAKAVRAKNENVVAAVSLESIGMYSDQPGSQQYPAGFGFFYPKQGNFISFIGNFSSRGLVRQAIKSFRQNAAFPSEGVAAPAAVPGVSWSDHWSFWRQGYPAIMVTDTAPFRNKNYHLPGDQANTLDYDRTARVVDGLSHVIIDLAR